ncbi:hypothetical protein SAY86_007095 [Trapa natans]|uniref:Uncharacterized protein n=1 Tax=Trapa natans TaxID=22666 RepID=A0AAN7LL42_TRANT|nr:hypothetical protein SAY86_007095 [Trapa natans]
MDLGTGEDDAYHDCPEHDSEGSSMRVPPHEYLAMRRGASFSMHEGAGRTLKGHDLRLVRNASGTRLVLKTRSLIACEYIYIYIQSLGSSNTTSAISGPRQRDGYKAM